ncbi:hypothetical protein GQ600_7869 [Phytophthora cactorum]|nr:hypothetical protein GQ600_7869 [Phytophthora cactorum]
MIFTFCFAQDINNLVKAILQSTFRAVAGQAAAAVNCMNASSSKWLKCARRLMTQYYDRSLGLRSLCATRWNSLCATRWNSMQGCVASLFRVRSALQMFYRQYKIDDDFPTCLHVLGDIAFWSKLKSAEAVIAPLCYASYRLQREDNTVGDVVLSYSEIYRAFSQDGVRREELVKCVEHRWSQC